MGFFAAGTVVSLSAIPGPAGITLPLPGVQDGHFLIAFMARDQNVGTFDTIAGWDFQSNLSVITSTGRNRSTAVYTRIASSEPASYTFTHSDTSAEQWAGQILAYNVDTTSPFDVTPTLAHQEVSTNKSLTNTDTFPSITTVTDEAIVVAFEMVSHSDITSVAAPPGYTARAYHTGGTFFHRQMLIFDRTVATAGTETPGVAAYTSDQSVADSTRVTFALRPNLSPPDIVLGLRAI